MAGRGETTAGVTSKSLAGREKGAARELGEHVCARRPRRGGGAARRSRDRHGRRPDHGPHRRAGRPVRGRRRRPHRRVGRLPLTRTARRPPSSPTVLAGRDLAYRQRIVHHMVLGELVLRPIPTVVAHRVAQYAEALGVQRRLRAGRSALRTGRVRPRVDGPAAQWLRRPRAGGRRQRSPRRRRPERDPPPRRSRRPNRTPSSRRSWAAFADLPHDTLGLPRVGHVRQPRLRAARHTGGALRYLAQHDFVHVLADYGTNLKGELEVFALIGRADPDPKGFAWLATLTGLFETGYIPTTGFFDRDVRERNLQAPGMHHRVADAIRRGKATCANRTTSTCSRSTTTRSPTDRSPNCRSDCSSRRSRPLRSRAARRGSPTWRACPRTNAGSSPGDEESTREPQLQPVHHHALQRSRATGRDARAVGHRPGGERHHGFHGRTPARRSRRARALHHRGRLRRRSTPTSPPRTKRNATTIGPRPRRGRRAC